MDNTTDNIMQEHTHWAENIIIADANYIDRVAFDLTVHFERVIDRRIPKADLARWVDCVALDGGLREGAGEVQVLLIHGKGDKAMDNFAPSDFADEINGKAFKDHLGEFAFTTLPVEDIVTRTQFVSDIVGAACIQPNVRRVMIIPDSDDGVTYEHIAHALRHVDDNKRITMFAMRPMPGGNFRQEILGYSLLSALGIKPDEIK